MTSPIGVGPRDKSRLRSGLGASELHRSQRIEAALFDAARDRSAKAALIDGSWSLDYGSLAEWAEQFAANLLARGLHRGDRVSMFFDKTPESVVALYGVWSAGGVAVPVNGGLRSRQLEYIVQHSGSKYFASTERKFNTLQPGILGNITRLEVEPLQKGSTRQATRPSGEEEEELAAILYTSGSTGRPKGVALSHANLCAGVRIVTRYLEIQEDERILSILPFSFDYGLNQLLTTVGQSATLVLHRSPLAGDICRSLTKHEITGLAGVPPLWIQLVQNRSPFSNMSFPQLRYVTNSGGAMPVDVVKALRRVLPNTKIYLMYGLTEAFRSTYLPPEEVDRRPDSIGKSIPECDILILSEGGGLCGPNEIGELVHCGPTVALGYWQDPEATAAKFRPNPFAPELLERVVYSGDLVKKDEEGFFYFVGRRDEMIKSLGYRISPTEVEEVIFESGLVAEVVVKGTPDPVAGQALVVHCIPAIPNTFSVQQLLAYCKKEMPSYMMPKSVAVHTMLPRTPSGKIDRKAVGT
jgi:acyl-CoA ligase (AMP-forming) (exosortase A-associated)